MRKAHTYSGVGAIRGIAASRPTKVTATKKEPVEPALFYASTRHEEAGIKYISPQVKVLHLGSYVVLC